MHVICTAFIGDAQQISNLCECVKILGGVPSVSGNTVCVEYDGSPIIATQLMDLFAQYPFHGISMLAQRG